MKKLRDMTGEAGAIFLCVAEMMVGVLLLINPAGFTKGIIMAFGVLLGIGGVVTTIGYFRTAPAQAAVQQKLAKGLILLALGLFCVCNADWFIAAFPILTMLYGVASLFLGVMRIQWTVDNMRMKTGKWLWSAIGAALTLAFAAIILCNPFASTTVLWAFVGITLIIEAGVDVVALVMTGKKA